MIDATYIDHCGTDLSVVNAARVSFGKKSEYLEDKHGFWYLSEKDTNLINYLANHKHYSPFGHCFASFHVKAPIFVARQLVKHKFLRWNEISRRYVDSEPEFYVPQVWRGRSEDKKQGSTGVIHNSSDPDFVNFTALRTYSEMIELGIAPEQARMVLPQSTMTEWYWSGSLDAFADMCKLRCKDDTQYETRIVSDKISKVMRDLFPYSWGALLDEHKPARFKQEPNVLVKLDDYNGWEYWNEGTK